MPTYGFENASSSSTSSLLLLAPAASNPHRQPQSQVPQHHPILCQNISSSSVESLSNSTNCFDAAEAAMVEPVAIQHMVLFLILLTFCLATVLGNILVVLAVIRESSLHTATNYFVTSLAVADCLVGTYVRRALGMNEWCYSYRPN